MAYSHTNSKGVTYHLHYNERTTKAGKTTKLYFFSRDIRLEKAVAELPADLQDFQAALARDRRPGSVKHHAERPPLRLHLGSPQEAMSGPIPAPRSTICQSHRSGTAAALGRRILTHTETARLLEAARPGRDFALYLTLYHTGCRVFKALALRWEDLNLEGLLPSLTVLHGEGVIRLSEPLRQILTELCPAAARLPDLVFAARMGRPLARNNVWMSLCWTVQRAGINRGISSHWFRHAHTSHALDGGAPVHSVKETLGHASLATTSGLWLD